MRPMKVHGTPTRTIWPVAGADAVEIIDQTALPYSYRVLRLNSLDDVAQGIRSMQVRGAPLIGVSAAYGIALALSRRADDATLLAALQTLAAAHSGARIAVFTHGGALDMVWRELHGLPLAGPRECEIPNTGFNRLRWTDGQLELLQWADTSHLG